MNDQQKEARKKSAMNGHIKWIKDNCLRTKDDNEDFVFISYKSDDYEQVLNGIVYDACRKYGLKVYFDTAFDDGSESWINQFYENMKSIHCKAFLAFIDNKYYESYATLLEMMASRTVAAGGDYKYNSMYFLPINLEPITEPTDEVLKQNTGLGTKRFADNTINNQAEKELLLFNELYEELVDANARLKPYYKRYLESGIELYEEKTVSGRQAYGKEYLNKSQCRAIMSIVMPGSNENDGKNKDYVEAIYDKLAEYRGVFIKDWKSLDGEDGVILTKTTPTPTLTATPVSNDGSWQAYSLDAFIKNFNDKNFTAKQYDEIKIIGKGKAATYFTDEIYKSPGNMVRDFADRLAKLLGSDHGRFFDGFAGKSASPIFITSAEWDRRKKENKSDSYSAIQNTTYCINTHMSPCRWITYVLKEIVIALGLEPQDIIVNFAMDRNTTNASGANVVKKKEEADHKKEQTTKQAEPINDVTEIDEPISLYGIKKSDKKMNGTYDFKLYGVDYKEKTLRELMIMAFAEVLERHTDKIDDVIDALPSYVDRGNRIDKNLTTSFRAGKVVWISGNEISIATAINQQTVLNNIRKLMQITGENRDNLVIAGYEY